MKSGPVIGILIVVGTVVCEAIANSSGVRPIKFAASIQGFTGASYRVEMTTAGDIVYLANPHTFTSAPGMTRTRISIPPDRWSAFRRRLDTTRVWSWRSDYSDRRVADGTVGIWM
jgi:hypothetical protein